MMKTVRTLAFAFALAMVPLAGVFQAAFAAQSTVVMPTTGPLTMGSFVSTYLNPALQSLTTCWSGASAPASPAPVAGQCWWDTTANPYSLKYYDGASWTSVGTLNTSTHVWTPASGGGLVVGTSAITSGTTTRILYDNAGALGEYTITGTGTVVAMQAGPTFTGTLTGSIGAFSSTLTSAAHAITSASANALAVGLNGSTNPALQIDASTASSATGLKVKSAAAAGGLALSVITSGTNENLTLDAAGSGTITLGGTSTGAIIHTRATTLSAALTYGGVTLSNAVTGTGNMVLATSPTLTTPALGVATGTSLAIGGATIGSNALAVTGTALFNGAAGFVGGANVDGSTLSIRDNPATTTYMRLANGGFFLGSSQEIQFSSTTNAGGTIDTLFGRNAPATIRFGDVDAAAPVAQTLQFQNGATLNTAGVNATIIGSLSSGSGNSGDIIIQTGVKSGVSGTLATKTTALTIKGENGGIVVGSGGNGLITGGTAAGNELQFATAGSSGAWKISASNAGQHFFAVTDGTQDIGGAGGGRPRSIFSTASISANMATAIPAGGTAGAGYNFSSTSNFGIYFGSNAPTLSAAKGSLYLRSDGTTNTTRMYVNTDGGTTWTAVNTVS